MFNPKNIFKFESLLRERLHKKVIIFFKTKNIFKFDNNIV